MKLLPVISDVGELVEVTPPTLQLPAGWVAPDKEIMEKNLRTLERVSALMDAYDNEPVADEPIIVVGRSEGA